MENVLCLIFIAAIVGGTAGLMAAEIASTLRDGRALVVSVWRWWLRWVRR